VLTRLSGTLLALALLPPMSQYVLSVAHWVDNYFGGNRAVTLGSANVAVGGLDYEFLLRHQPTGGYAWVLRAHNNTDAPVTLNYASGQAYDFIVRQDDAVLWRASTGMRYTQMLVTEVLPPHQTKVFEAAWDGTLPGGGIASGKVEAEARHLLTPDPSTIALDVSLPAP
jgi:hypothetical protein